MTNGIDRHSGGDADDDQDPPVRWLAADRNPWGVPVLDARPVTLGTLSTSKDPRRAANAVSFAGDDGTSFIGVAPEVGRSVPASLRYPIDRYLADGAAFLPDAMEHKWALFLHRGQLIFVRSWLRRVIATATVEVGGGFAALTAVRGAFVAADEDAAFTARVADYLVRSHALGEVFPAPLPERPRVDPRDAALWCMSNYGKMAHFATPHVPAGPPPRRPLRTHSLLHIAVARGDLAAVNAQLDRGVPADLLAGDGLAPLHWAIAARGRAAAELLLSRGSPVDVRSDEGATPLMNAVQAGSLEWSDFLLAHGADPDARDRRGFTALHRAAEMGKVELVRRLLEAGAAADVEAEGHTPLSLARGRNEAAVIQLLGGC